MTTRMMCAAVVLGTALIAGCQSDSGSYQTVRMPGNNYDQAFDVTRQVLAEQFSIEKADKSSGRILTSPQAVSASDALSLASDARGVRRIVSAQVKASGSTMLISLKVKVQKAYAVQQVPRPTYNEFNPTTTGSETDLFVRPENKSGVVWQDAGSDSALENKLLREIQTRLTSVGVETEAPSKAPTEVPEIPPAEKGADQK